MDIDRATFLLFATTLASSLGTACGPRRPIESATGSSDPDAGVAAPTATAPTTTATAPTAAPTPSGYWPTPTGEGGYHPPQGEGGYYPPAGEGYWPAPTKEGGYYPPPPPPPPPPPFKATACSGDEVGTPGSCANLKFDKSCAPFPFVTSACNDAVKYYKPKIAERAVACINKLTPKKLCDAMTTYNCKDAALRSACSDSTADASCMQILSACKGTSMSECKGYLSGMNDVGRAAMVKCMSNKSYCGFGLYSCTESL